MPLFIMESGLNARYACEKCGSTVRAKTRILGALAVGLIVGLVFAGFAHLAYFTLFPGVPPYLALLIVLPLVFGLVWFCAPQLSKLAVRWTIPADQVKSNG